ncbi:hypothetical protein [Actinokineospora enzanensis]|uniref:hypothetical protein n=1 Tax=Actinokineospora enzanensis TaxID=155975 RepID=UPI0003817FAF|nr:hypothetical protein [Actinokineospora enzanensis]
MTEDTIPLGEPDPLAQYRELLDLARHAARRHADRERKRAVDLVGEISAADRAIAKAREEEKQIRAEVIAWWRRVAATSANVSWLPAFPEPKPDLSARPEQLGEYLGDIEPATKAFQSALRRTSWLKR